MGNPITWIDTKVGFTKAGQERAAQNEFKDALTNKEVNSQAKELVKAIHEEASKEKKTAIDVRVIDRKKLLADEGRAEKVENESLAFISRYSEFLFHPKYANARKQIEDSQARSYGYTDELIKNYKEVKALIYGDELKGFRESAQKFYADLDRLGLGLGDIIPLVSAKRAHDRVAPLANTNFEKGLVVLYDAINVTFDALALKWLCALAKGAGVTVTRGIGIASRELGNMEAGNLAKTEARLNEAARIAAKKAGAAEKIAMQKQAQQVFVDYEGKMTLDKLKFLLKNGNEIRCEQAGGKVVIFEYDAKAGKVFKKAGEYVGKIDRLKEEHQIISKRVKEIEGTLEQLKKERIDSRVAELEKEAKSGLRGATKMTKQSVEDSVLKNIDARSEELRKQIAKVDQDLQSTRSKIKDMGKQPQDQEKIKLLYERREKVMAQDEELAKMREYLSVRKQLEAERTALQQAGTKVKEQTAIDAKLKPEQKRLQMEVRTTEEKIEEVKNVNEFKDGTFVTSRQKTRGVGLDLRVQERYLGQPRFTPPAERVRNFWIKRVLSTRETNQFGVDAAAFKEWAIKDLVIAGTKPTRAEKYGIAGALAKNAYKAGMTPIEYFNRPKAAKPAGESTKKKFVEMEVRATGARIAEEAEKEAQETHGTTLDTRTQKILENYRKTSGVKDATMEALDSSLENWAKKARKTYDRNAADKADLAIEIIRTLPSDIQNKLLEGVATATPVMTETEYKDAVVKMLIQLTETNKDLATEYKTVTDQKATWKEAYEYLTKKGLTE